MVGAFYSFGKAIIGVKDLILTKKVLIFSQKVQNKLVSDVEMKRHLEDLCNNPKKLHKELEVIITYLNRHTKYTKSLMLANFYILYLGREIEWC